jgi:hypothetical protein
MFKEEHGMNEIKDEIKNKIKEADDYHQAILLAAN